ncbi:MULTISPECIES: FeoA family protein [Clostridium]|uniref:Ferrous iron transporter FeoA-like domain-containing protein n=1 Tax=Clostridium nitritogenes TaxID=83340 RepID=A0ABN1LU21_9CLOT|nr:FeoA family protein [Clostridium baratii]AQM59458.1 iron transporter FeoA [Clostridium baratii]KJU71761.1 iron transporter FeoA [Clostridium baratii]MBS6042862.1 ferrous iron transport protein A [Clostridium baratii]MBT9830278.1 ferrous iron transport protein A [Clostridium baratii]MDY3206512.1 FeoA family protein [Clostridium baratii]
MKLKEANLNSVVRVININARGELRRRFFDLGIIEGTNIEVLFKGPFGDPVAYSIRGTVIALREEDGEKIEVIDC